MSSKKNRFHRSSFLGKTSAVAASVFALPTIIPRSPALIDLELVNA